jgi:spore coat protein U-like protein
VPANCLVSTSGVNFGSSGAITGNVDAAGTASVQCTSTTPYVVALNGGNSGATDPTKRQMARGSETITYGLYRDSVRSLPWGSTTGVNTASGTGSGASQSLTRLWPRRGTDDALSR